MSALGSVSASSSSSSYNEAQALQEILRTTAPRRQQNEESKSASSFNSQRMTFRESANQHRIREEISEIRHLLRAPNAATVALKESVVRRKLKAELDEIGQFLKPSYYSDVLTNEIRNWHHDFVNTLNRSPDEEWVLHQFIGLLQEILKDPLSFTPLDDRSLLGSDGRTYAFKPYCLFLNSAPHLRNRSPLEPENEAAFTASPHPIVPKMLDWLSNHNALQSSPRIDQQFSELETIPIIPSDRNNRIASIMASVAERALRLEEASLNPSLQNRIEAFSSNLLQNLDDRMSLIASGFQEEIEKVRAESEDNQKIFQKQIAVLQEGTQIHREKNQQLSQQNEQLKTELAELGDSISKTAKDNIQLRIDLNEARIAIENRNNDWLRQLGMAALTITCCAAAQWLLPEILAIGPLEGGGYVSAGIPW